MEARNFNMLRKPTVSQKEYVERQGYWVNATGHVSTDQEHHIAGLLKTYDGKLVAVLGKDQWASTIKPRDRRTQYIPGDRQTDQIEVSKGRGFAIRRTQVVQDRMVPYLTERHRMKGVAPIPRTTTKTVEMAVPASLVTSLRQSARRSKKGPSYLMAKAARLLDEHPGASLNSQTWSALLAKAGTNGSDKAFSRLMKALGGRPVGRVLGIKCWTLKVAQECLEGPRPHAKPLPPSMVFAGGKKANAYLLRIAQHKKVKGRKPKGFTFTQEPTRPLDFGLA